MQEVFDPPEMERETETKNGTGTSIRKEPDLSSSYQLWGNMKFEEDRQLLSQAKRDLPHVDYQESNYVTDLRSHAYSEDPLPLGREYHRQKSYLPTSNCSWEKSFAFEAAPSSRDALGKMRTKISNLSARPDYLGSYPAPHMRKHLGEVELDYGLDHSEHFYRRSGRFTAFPSRNGPSVEHCNEVNTSGQFVGLAEMLGPVDFKKTMDFWKEDKWNGFFSIIWHIIKDIPNRLFRHIILEHNDHRPVTFSRDTQEIGLLQGVQMLKIFKDHPQGTSILDDFDFYEEKDTARRAQKKENSESTHQSGFPEDLEPMGNLEASMERWTLCDNWD
ncbi:unnamed protein product [Urochloa humidicola]